MALPAPREDGPAAQGPARWFDKPATSGPGAMPVLDDVMAAAAQAWSDSFAALASMPGEVTFAGLRAGKVEGLVERRGPASVLATVHAPAWDTLLLLHFDRAFVTAMVEALFGGTADEAEAAPPPLAPLSSVETRIAEVVAGQAADALTAGFAAVRPTAFVFQRILPKLDAGILGRHTTPLVIATLALVTAGRRVELDVVLPQAVLDGFGDALSGAPEAATADADPRWTRQLENEVAQAMMRLQASIAAQPMSLGDIARLRPGQVLTLPYAAGSGVMLRCEGDELFRCELGQSAGRYTVRIDEPAALSRRKPD